MITSAPSLYSKVKCCAAKTYSNASKCASEHIVGKTEAGWKTFIAEGDCQ